MVEAACRAEVGVLVHHDDSQSDHYCPFLCNYYMIMTCYDSNDGSVITYHSFIITSLYLIHLLLHHYYIFNTPVITSLLPVITVIINHY